MKKITSIPMPSTGQILTYLVLSDIHSIYADMNALDKALKMLMKVEPDNRRIILLGDILDFEFLHGKHPGFIPNVKNKEYEEYFIPLMEDECTWAEMLLGKCKEVVGSFNRIYFAEGNHEERLRRSTSGLEARRPLSGGGL